MIDALDRDRDGLLDSYENVAADAFVPQYRLSTVDGDPDPAAREGSGSGLDLVYPEPVVIHQLTPMGFEGGSVRLRVRYIHLYTRDPGCVPNQWVGPCPSIDWDSHLGDMDWINWSALLDPVTNTTVFAPNPAYHAFPGSDGHVVVFVSFRKHHEYPEPDADQPYVDCDCDLGSGRRVDPIVFGSQVGSFCEGTWEPSESPEDGCEPTTQCCWAAERGWQCVQSFNPWSERTPNRLLNYLGNHPWGYPWESVYSSLTFAGGLLGPHECEAFLCRDHRNGPIRVMAYAQPFLGPAGTAVYDDGVRLDLGGPGCGLVLAGTVVDGDQDGIPDECDPCPARPDTPIWNGGEVVAFQDLDHDTVPDGCDMCPGRDDRLNTNLDGEEVNGRIHLPDGCDPYATARIDRAEAPRAVVVCGLDRDRREGGPHRPRHRDEPATDGRRGPQDARRRDDRAALLLRATRRDGSGRRALPGA
ncbi:MAG: hypothetical protein IT373_06195 [Polyangiaceae bacterium]|nr:hypothetical protein [Polyangiaceae bacterium]